MHNIAVGSFVAFCYEGVPGTMNALGIVKALEGKGCVVSALYPNKGALTTVKNERNIQYLGEFSGTDIPDDLAKVILMLLEEANELRRRNGSLVRELIDAEDEVW